MYLFAPHTRWDIFCNVIDNYGDIGVCWRLAKQLANEQQQQVRLWVDDLVSFQKICPAINLQLSHQSLFDVDIYPWPKKWAKVEVADIVIEAFACTIPEPYIKAMAEANKAVLWLNLEYLTYQDWSINCHALPSLQSNGLNKYFFFMGLEQTGGLIRERLLTESQQAFQANPLAQQTFLKNLGVTKQAGSYLLFIFSYANNQLASWLKLLEQSAQSYQLLLPQTPLLANLADYLKIPISALTVGYQYQQGSLSLQIIPFVTQELFDALLCCTDVNLVRGEDSFVRAQYAGKPMLWHIYQQDNNAHLDKLEAFLDYYLIGLLPAIQQAVRDFWFAWNNQQDLTTSWQNYQKYLPELEKHAKIWAENQKTADDLLTKLANFYKNWLS